MTLRVEKIAFYDVPENEVNEWLFRGWKKARLQRGKWEKVKTDDNKTYYRLEETEQSLEQTL